MSVAAGREFLSIPGPTVIPDAVLAAMQRPAVDIYAGRWSRSPTAARRPETHLRARRAAPTSTPPTATAPGRRRSPTCSRAATRCWCSKAAASRSAGARRRRCWARRSRCCPATSRRAVRPEAVEARLKADKGIKAILVAQIDTASGVVKRHQGDRARRCAPPGSDALLMVDAVASLGCMPFEMDAWGVDVAMAGSQKGLMTPPGLGFTAAGAARARARTRGQHAHALLGLDLPRGRGALPQILRHAAGAPAVRRCAPRST